MKHQEILKQFAEYLHQEEKSEATREKYLRSIRHFYDYLWDKPITKQEIISYKQSLLKRYKISTVNGILIALNLFFRFLMLSDYCVKLAKVQRKIFCRCERE